MKFPTGHERRAPARRGFTITEITVALGVLGAVLLLLAQLGVTALRQRQRNTARQEALEAAANVLEAARATAWEDLTPAWADRHVQRLHRLLAPGMDSRRPPQGRGNAEGVPGAVGEVGHAPGDDDVLGRHAGERGRHPDQLAVGLEQQDAPGAEASVRVEHVADGDADPVANLAR